MRIRDLLGGGGIPAIGPEEAHELHEQREVVLLDVRTTRERREVRIPGSLHIPLQELPGRLDEIPRERPVILQCRSGSRSARATRLLVREGVEDARNLRNGLIGWHRAGLPLER